MLRSALRSPWGVALERHLKDNARPSNRSNKTQKDAPMPLAKITVPADLNKRPFSQPSENAIDQTHEAIERFMLAAEHFFDNFVNCDFHLVDQAISCVCRISCLRSMKNGSKEIGPIYICLLYTSPSPRDQRGSRMPSSA